MRLIVSSREDKASQNILKKLLANGWDKIDEWRDNPVYRRGEDYIAIVNEHHIYAESIDRELKEVLQKDIDHMVFISKHASEAGIHSLTVHPIGNFGQAKFGGKDEELVPPAPHEMTEALRVLWDETRKAGIEGEYEVSFEVTHHGPYLETPTYYIEIGSDETCWTDDSAGEVIASTLMRKEEIDEGTVLVCIGGGHYAPKFTDLARHKRVSIGHMVPDWAMSDLDKEGLRQALKKTKAEALYLDRDSIKGTKRKKISQWVDELGVEVVTSDDLEDI